MHENVHNSVTFNKQMFWLNPSIHQQHNGSVSCDMLKGLVYSFENEWIIAVSINVDQFQKQKNFEREVIEEFIKYDSF